MALSWKWISFQLTCFTLLVTGRNPFGGTLGDDGDPAGPAQGRAVLACPGPVGPLALRGGPFHLFGRTYGLRGVVRLSATVRLHALVGKKDGHTFAPNGRNVKLDIGCQDLSGLVLTR